MDGTAVQRFFAHGECANCLSQANLADRLRQQGLAIEARRYSLGIGDCEHLSLEFDRDTDNEATLEGTSTSLDRLKADVRRVVDALAAAGAPCWVEVTDDEQRPLAYFHHQWPTDQGHQAL